MKESLLLKKKHFYKIDRALFWILMKFLNVIALFYHYLPPKNVK